MAAKTVWVRNLFGAPGPMIFLVKTLSGTAGPLSPGDICELDGTGAMVRLATNKAMTAEVAFYAGAEFKAGDLAGYRPFFIPRPGDVFKLGRDPADTDDNPAPGTLVYLSGQNLVTTVDPGAGVPLGNIADDGHVPEQGNLTIDASPDAGTTLRAVPEYFITIDASASYFAALQTT